MSTSSRAMGTPLQTALEAPERLAALAETGLLDAPSQVVLDRYVRLVRLALGTPVALVSLVDDHRQFFTSAEGLPEPWASRRETPLSHSFCKHVVHDRAPLIVENALEHPVVEGNLAIDELSVHAYAGMPIRTSDGLVLGSFCAVDTQPRVWTERELAILRDLAEAVGEAVDLRRRVRRAEASEKALAELNESLHAQQLEQSSSARAAAHDLRAPLSVLMLGVTNLLGHDASHSYPEIGKLLQAMQRNVGHASSLVASMYDITKLSAEHDGDSSIDLRELAAEVAEDLPTREGVTIEWDGCDVPLALEGDRTGLRRSIENLVSNALRFAESRVVVRTRARDDEAELVVEDDGPGLPTLADYRAVWETNARFHVEDGRSGSGLGLSIVREVVRRHGGTVRARPSKTLGGAKFVIYLPLE